MSVRVTVPKGAMAALEASIKQKLANVVEDVGLQVYNSIVMNVVESPYYSGSYISSWTISKGLPKIGTFNAPPTPMRRGVYDNPNAILDLGGVKFGQNVYITNAAPHAKQVEYDGTPRHDGGWKTAAHAKNLAVLTYKFRLRP